MPHYALVAGVPRAGKTTFCRALAAREPGFTQVELDRYIRPIAGDFTFNEWLATPACIDWDLLRDHLAVLDSGRACYTPRADWNDGGRRLSEGGPIAAGPGTLMQPAARGYLIPGSHAFACTVRESEVLRVFVDSPEPVLAARFGGAPVAPQQAAAAIAAEIGPNARLIYPQAAVADLRLDGTAARDAQIAAFMAAYTEKFPDEPT